MPDRSLRLSSLLLRERSSSPTPPRESEDVPENGRPSAPSDENPFAPPPEGAPDQPWRPRGQGQDSGDGDGSPWGSQWSDRQPGRAPGGHFGERPGGPGGPGGPAGGPEGGPGSGLRWDPTDPAQRRARYALLSGMWAFFFVLFGWPYVALLLGALALHWGISALRAKPPTPDPTAPAPAPGPRRPQKTAAISGLVTASLALVMVAATFSLQFVYRDYYTCVNDSLTTASKKSCEQLIPKELRDVLSTS
ncbi:hypothetical protein SGFS_073330 [Streptomyces graminofaciens]|uniref:Integral membrane protein n=1 Tax=Streptomyces graminofaciens TaxID=68212 RepID=A0ABM7FG52_9ACTN|nr:hypothetical protein [Streptomyces graminofaciens]BBC36039.1 hypothetical protein SGFS_073330 [Streptomyces graminofaciens]